MINAGHCSIELLYGGQEGNMGWEMVPMVDGSVEEWIFVKVIGCCDKSVAKGMAMPGGFTNGIEIVF